MSVQQAIEDIENLEPTTREYLVENLDQLANDNLVFEVVAVAKAMNLPVEFIHGIAWVRTGDLSGKIVNTWGTAEKPLAEWFNDGTPDHWLEPLTPDGVIVFEASFGRNAPAIFFAGNVEEGSLLFSKGHMVSGLDKTEAMERGIEAGWNRFKAQVIKNTKQDVSKELETID